jgi:hypothetical protein
MINTEREIKGESIAPSLEQLLRDVGMLLLNDETPQHRSLQAQLKAAVIDRIVLTGAGLFAYFIHVERNPVEIVDVIGGEVQIDVNGLDAPAGSLVSVRDGLIDYIEIYTYGDMPWPDEPKVVSLSQVLPLPVHLGVPPNTR